MDLLQIATGITKCDDYYKLRQYKRSVPQNNNATKIIKKKKKQGNIIAFLTSMFLTVYRADLLVAEHK